MYAIRPSAAWIWMSCHGYARMSARYPELAGDDTVREEGTAGHWVAHMLGQGFKVQEGAIAPNKVEVDAEMLEGAETYVELLRASGAPVYQEMTLPAAWIHSQCGGTSDAWSWDALTNTLRVWDYKYGYRFVDAFENPQLAIYVSAILDYLQRLGLIVLNGHTEQEITVEMTVVQPRSYSAEPVRTWRCKVAMLRALWNKLRAAAIETLSDDPGLRSGPHCMDCSARHDCPAALRSTEVGLELSAKLIPVNLSSAAQGDLLRRVKAAQDVLKSMADGLEAQLLHAIANGHVDPNWQTGNGRSSTRFIEGGEDQFLALAQYMKLHGVTKPVRAKTPKQIQALVDPRLIERFIETIPGRKRLVPFNARTIRKLLT